MLAKSWHTMWDDSAYRTPGQLIQDTLEKRGLTQRVLSMVLGIGEATINKVITGKKPLDATLAVQIGEVLELEPKRLMALQTAYELGQAQLVLRPDPTRVNRAHLFGRLPIMEMIKRGWIYVENPKDAAGVEAALATFFHAASPGEIEILPHATKRTNVSEEVTAAQLAWLYRVKEIASEMMVPRKYSPAATREAINKLKPLRTSAEAVRKVPRILTEAGIRFLIVEALAGSEIDGVCFWLDELSPVIALSLRYDRIDNFWFVLRHELEHVIRGHGRNQFRLDSDLEGERAGVGPLIPEEERLANAAAAEFCVPQKSLDDFIARKAPFFAERDIIGFSRVMEIHPGIVAGQLQHRLQRFDRFRPHLAKVRETVMANAFHDGWGDVAPVGD